ncbi:hypothetical protein [Ilumatobacter coccineus]|uniref:Uncharacterized protein n=1 Tax=Ilumatobacter coccineus (strain NBRC 103263 / KCTC 29153 / YM16-304) TaxID=1313172 RepID=A0A6C7ED17_ILUCY|nr:hypothetical protein [Ilumatobacter coccineus]BAN04260.1 hypothetical protein YM304_39460 [Ilumatobacter coccineus YM16-304]
MSTLFREASDRNELLAFALGRGRYFVHDRSGIGHGEHWVLGSWRSSIMALHRDDPAACATGVRDMFAALVADAPSAPDQHAWVLLDHLHQFWRAQSGGAQLDLGAAATPIAQIIATERARFTAGGGDGEGVGGAEAMEIAIDAVRRLGGLAELARRRKT